MTCSKLDAAEARPQAPRAVPPTPTRPSVVLSDAPLSKSRRLCDNVLLPSTHIQSSGLSHREGTQDRLLTELLIHSPTSAVFCATEPTAHNNFCSQSPCSSSQSPTAASPDQTPQSSHQGSVSSLNSPIYLPQCLSPSSSEASYLSYWLPSESLDWREWIDEIVDEVRNEINSEIMFNQLAQPSHVKSSGNRKRKAQTSSPASVDSGVSSALSPSSQSSCPSKRAKKYSLAALSHEEIAERKKEQNRVAAQRYRSRKTQTLEQGREEITFLEKRNADLKLEMYALEQEIKQVKQQLVGQS